MSLAAVLYPSKFEDKLTMTSLQHIAYTYKQFEHLNFCRVGDELNDYLLVLLLCPSVSGLIFIVAPAGA